MARTLLALACAALLAGPASAEEAFPAAAIGLRSSIGEVYAAAPEPARLPGRARAFLAVAPPALPRSPRGGSADLMDAVSIAIGESDLVRSSVAERDAADTRVGRAWAAFAPVVSGTAWIGRDPYSAPSYRDPGKTAGISVALPLLDGGQRLYSQRSAENAALAASAEVRRTTEGVALETINAAVELNFAVRQAKVLEENFRDLTRLQAAVRGRVAAGHASEGDVADLVAELNDVARTLVAAQASAEKSQAVLSAQLRQASPGRFVLPNLDAVQRHGLDNLARLTRARNAGLQASWHRYNAADDARKAAIGRYLPRLDLKADYRATENYRSVSAPEGLSLGLQLNVPLVELTTLADIREAGELADAAMHRALAEDRKAATQLKVGWVEAKAAAERAKFARRKIEALQAAYAAKVDQYGIGLLPIDDVLLTRRRLALATTEELESVNTRFAAIARLALTAGLLPEIVGARGALASLRPDATAGALSGDVVTGSVRERAPKR
ncbi:TolC family protein [Methylobacterium dankookense]|uniref:Outer membrane efflux protein BepC n=1 Tax=Methylobacterium dankookense TaxID=560405 RepID=A0A564G1M4_9HYPH|nr:TolC family protein [Methylobacterium dankookense]GJD56373.1 hypothetical protein IFDJLNFL_2268 [Methylobacterium dankookense]VUF14369.1 hypothetical protein MTDSW087_04089 [Methylobacterium dankookense]